MVGRIRDGSLLSNTNSTDKEGEGVSGIEGKTTAKRKREKCRGQHNIVTRVFFHC